MLGIEAAWERITTWCRTEAPANLAGLRPPATDDQIDQVAAAVGREWPDDLRRWFGLCGGITGHPYAVIFPGYWPMPLADVRPRSQMYQQISTRMDAEDAARAEQASARAARMGLTGSSHRSFELAQRESEPAGTVAGMFLSSFVPFGDNGSACELFVDTRPGPQWGCVTAYRREDADHAGPEWPSLTALLEAVAESLERNRSVGYWHPVVSEGVLSWDVR